jgi:hypothetical protein
MEGRLNETKQRRALGTMFLSILGIIALIAVLIKFGPQLLIQYSMIVEKVQGTKVPGNNSDDDMSIVAPPTLDVTKTATNSAKMTITGYSQPKQIIKLYVNGDLTDKTEVKSDKSFTFKNVSLEPGENEIKAKAMTDNDKESEYSSPVTITYVNKKPRLTVDSPSDGQTVKDNHLNVTGKTDSGNRVTVNGSLAITSGETFSYTMQLQNGDNHLTVEATDDAGNTTKKDLKVTYSP